MEEVIQIFPCIFATNFYAMVLLKDNKMQENKKSILLLFTPNTKKLSGTLDYCQNLKPLQMIYILLGYYFPIFYNSKFLIFSVSQWEIWNWKKWQIIFLKCKYNSGRSKIYMAHLFFNNNNHNKYPTFLTKNEGLFQLNTVISYVEGTWHGKIWKYDWKTWVSYHEIKVKTKWIISRHKLTQIYQQTEKLYHIIEKKHKRNLIAI